MSLAGKKIGFGITASFCTVMEILPYMQRLKDEGAEVYPVVSENVAKYSSRLHDRDEFLEKIRQISGRSEIDNILGAELFGPKIPLDIMVIAPATGNTLAKLANGITDGAVTMAAKATLRNAKPLLLAPFTNDALGANGINIMKLYNSKNIFFVPFGQDDPFTKPTSMTADLNYFHQALTHALDKKQLQPALVTHARQ